MRLHHHRVARPFHPFTRLAAIGLLVAAALAVTAGASHAQNTVREGASVTFVNALNLPVSIELRRSGELFPRLDPGAAGAMMLPQQRATFVTRVLGSGHKLLDRGVLREGRGYCLIVYRSARGPQAALVSVGAADAGAASGIPDPDCLRKARRFAR